MSDATVENTTTSGTETTPLSLAKRLVNCKHFRWLPGMLAKHPNFRGFRVSHVGRTGMHGACRYASPMGGVSNAVVALPLPTSSDVLPDLDDPATVGCLLALVREAWGDPLMQAMNAGGGWVGFRPAPIWTDKEGCYETEAEALVAALEAAP